MKVAVCVGGFLRSMSDCWPSVESGLLAPLRNHQAECDIHLALSFSRERVENPRSGESGFAEHRVPTEVEATSTSLTEQSLIDEAIALELTAAQRQGNAWPDDPSGVALLNALRFLFVIKELSLKIRRRNYDLVVFIRPDLELMEAIDVVAYGIEFPRSVCVPSWHSFGGFNDRFAIGDAISMNVYLSRWDQLRSWLLKGETFHSERYLASALKGLEVNPVISQKLVRVRLGGRRHNETFA